MIIHKTKRDKKVYVELTKVISAVSEYTCPTCKITFVGNVGGNVTRFKCSCGQELIVDTEEK